LVVNRVKGKAGDQFLDSEATGILGEEQWIQDLHIEDVYIEGHGGIALTLGRSKRVRLEKTFIENGTLFMLTGKSTSFRDVTVQCPDTDIACIEVRRAVSGIVLDNIKVYKPEGALINGPLLTVTTDADGSPEGVRITGGEFTQTTQEKAIFVGSSKVKIKDVEIKYSGPVPGGGNATAIVVNTTMSTKPAEVIVRDNAFRGTWTRAVLLGSNLGISIVEDNYGTAETGVLCEALGTTQYRKIDNNIFFKSTGQVANNAGC
jgi:hypothetical protein